MGGPGAPGKGKIGGPMARREDEEDEDYQEAEVAEDSEEA
jgi:hypothetical protein